MVERPLRERKVVGSNPGRAIPKALKMVPVSRFVEIQEHTKTPEHTNNGNLPLNCQLVGFVLSFFKNKLELSEDLTIAPL